MHDTSAWNAKGACLLPSFRSFIAPFASATRLFPSHLRRFLSHDVPSFSIVLRYVIGLRKARNTARDRCTDSFVIVWWEFNFVDIESVSKE